MQASSKIENVCNVCCGTGTPLSDLPCICKGTGLLTVAYQHLAELAAKLNDQNALLSEGLTKLVDRNMSYAQGYVAGESIKMEEINEAREKLNQANQIEI